MQVVLLFMSNRLYVRINPRTIELGATVIQISSIASLKIGELDKKYYQQKMKYFHFPGLISFILIIMVGYLLYLIGNENADPVEDSEILEGFFIGIFLYIGVVVLWVIGRIIVWSLTYKKETVLVIETNAGSQTLLVSRDKKRLVEVINSIQDYIENDITSPVYFDLSQDRSIRIEGNVGNNVNTGNINY